MTKYKILKKEDIRIPNDLLFSKVEYDEFVDKEAEIKKRFIEILRQNQRIKTVIRLVDLKNKYAIKYIAAMLCPEKVFLAPR